MALKVLHYVYFAHPIVTGYTVRTNSIVKSLKRNGLHPTVAISLKSGFKNYFNNVFFPSQNIIDDISFYSSHNIMKDNLLFKFAEKILYGNNKINRNLREGFYTIQNHEILNNYSKFLLSELQIIDLIHVHTPSITMKEAFQLNKSLKKKMIYEVRGFWNLSVENNDQDITKLVIDDIQVSKKANKCIAICKGIADVLVKGGVPANKIEIVPNAVEPDKFPIIKKDVGLTERLKLENKIIFGYVTNVRWFEGIQTIIKAWPKIIKKNPNAIFLLIGDGPYLEKLKSNIKELGIEKSFLTIGRIPHNDIAMYYSLIDIFVVPRINVPVSNIVTPLKPLEAMISKKAIIVSDVNALKEMVIDGETGLHFRADDEKHLAEVCIKLANDTELRTKLGEDGRKWVIKNRTWDINAKQYTEIYNNLIK